jgi:transcription antitermination protein NusB
VSEKDQRRLIQQRRQSRRLAMQALYQWQMTGHNVQDVLNQFLTTQDVSRADLDYFQELLTSIPGSVDKLDAALEPFMERRMKEVDPVERAILRLSAYELISRPDIPYKVVINEAIDLTKKFGADQAHRFVNGVLDKAVKELRKLETGQS